MARERKRSICLSVRILDVEIYTHTMDRVGLCCFSATFNNISISGGQYSWWRKPSILGGGNRSTRRKSPTYRKSLTNFITYCCITRVGKRCPVKECQRSLLNMCCSSLKLHFKLSLTDKKRDIPRTHLRPLVFSIRPNLIKLDVCYPFLYSCHKHNVYILFCLIKYTIKIIISNVNTRNKTRIVFE
jgi:hypothetical protein